MKPEVLKSGRLLRDEPLARYTAARLGGPADWLYIAKESLAELCEVVAAAWADDVPVRILGGGANVLVSDAGVRGLVVVNRINKTVFHEQDATCHVEVAGGANLGVLARKCAARGLSGLEWAVNVPGTVGGAVVNNAGAHGGDIAGILCDMCLLDVKGGERLVAVAEMDYDYRYSMLKARGDRRFLVLQARFALSRDDPARIQKRMAAYIAHRKATQPPGASLGSIFKNPPGDYAGRLIEAAGLKGHRIGGVEVSRTHANFFINTGGGTAGDYAALIGYARAVVAQRFGIELELEVELVGEGFERRLRRT